MLEMVRYGGGLERVGTIVWERCGWSMGEGERVVESGREIIEARDGWRVRRGSWGAGLRGRKAVRRACGQGVAPGRGKVLVM